MTVCIQKRDRCRICYSLIIRDRSTLFSSICCQKYYHLFKQIQRTKIPIKSIYPYKIKYSNRTVCFRDLILRYLHTEIQPHKNYSNFICYDCSKILLDVEQCAKYLTKTINQLKMKFNKTNRLMTSSLSATFQKKKQFHKLIKHEQLPISNSDNEEEFDDIDDDDEESEDEHNHTKPTVSTNRSSSAHSKSHHFTSPTSSACDSLSNIPQMNSTNRTNNNNNHGDIHDDEDENGNEEEIDEDDDEEEDGLIRKSEETKQKNFLSNFHPSSIPNLSDLPMNLMDEKNPNILQLQFAQMMANMAATSSTHNNGHNMDSMMNALANMQRNFLLKILSDPMGAAQATAAAAAAANVAAALPTQNKSNISAITSNNKQVGGGRKRKSTPEKRVIPNHRSTNNNNNNDDSSQNPDQELTDHPLELTFKTSQRSNRVSSSTDIQNLMINSKRENGSPSSSNLGQMYSHIDEDHKESTTPNDSSLSLSPSLNRRSTPTKRQRLSTTATTGQYDYTNPHHNLSMVNLPQTTTDLLSPNHHQQQQQANNDDSLNNQQKQQRKLDPRPCAECGKTLFSDKTHLLHCQTHAKNEKQCWICGVNDEDIKKHILNEHGNQKFTNTGFKCQHCEKVFPLFADLEAHTREHSKKKPFECPICHKRFGQQGNLSCHLRIHSGVKPFTCTSCGKAFRHSNSLRRHARTVHSAARGLTTPTGNSLLHSNATTMSNDMKNESYDDMPSNLMIPSDDGSSSTGGIPSPSISNTQVDSD